MAEFMQGMGQLRQSIKALDMDMRDRGARRIVMAGLSISKKEAKAIVVREELIDTRALLNNIAIKRQANAGAGIEQYHLGVRHGRDLGRKAIKYLAVGKGGRVVTRRKNDPYYWRFLELGHKIIPRGTGERGSIEKSYTRTTRRGKVRTVKYSVDADALSVRRRTAAGAVAAVPFIAPALETKKSEIIKAMEKQAARLILAKANL